VRSARSRSCWPGRDAHPLLVGDFALLCAPIEESRGVDSDPLPARHIQRRLCGGSHGKDAGGLSASTIARLKDVWSDEYQQWEKRDLSAKRHVYMWADGIHVQARLEDEAQCLLVIIGATAEGKKSLPCTPCRGGIPPLTRAQAELFHAQAPEWQLVEEAHRIERSFQFRNFREAFTFVREIAELAEAEGHHPNISFGWGNATVSLQTKKIKGLHENDFIMATKIDRIFARTATG
jgi:4a-hydroxytetrahydrobiopterin dehydratase